MANKYSKSNISNKAKEEKSMEDYRERSNKINKSARVMAIVMIAALVVTFVITAGLFALN